MSPIRICPLTSQTLSRLSRAELTPAVTGQPGSGTESRHTALSQAMQSCSPQGASLPFCLCSQCPGMRCFLSEPAANSPGHPS